MGQIVLRPAAVQVCQESQTDVQCVRNDSLESLLQFYFFLVTGVNFYEVSVLQFVHTVGVYSCVWGHDSIPGWTYSDWARGTYIVVLPKRSSCMRKGPLP